MQQDVADFQKKWAKIAARALTDDTFKQKLMKNPNSVLKENGIDVPQGTQCTIHEATDQQWHLVLPPKSAFSLSEKDLGNIAGGYACVGGCRSSH